MQPALSLVQRLLFVTTRHVVICPLTPPLPPGVGRGQIFVRNLPVASRSEQIPVPFHYSFPVPLSSSSIPWRRFLPYAESTKNSGRRTSPDLSRTRQISVFRSRQDL